MSDFEGSRSEFLKFLAELGEEPAFIARARAPEFALDVLLHACEAKRGELLEWPTFHLSVLAHQIGGDWSRLSCLLAEPESVTILEALHATLRTNKPVQTTWLASDRVALRRFLESAERFNRNWRAYLAELDLEPVNKPRRDFNQYYVIEKACALGSERFTEGFEPLDLIDYAYLERQFPLLSIPKPA